jgi:hypothetical protein
MSEANQRMHLTAEEFNLFVLIHRSLFPVACASAQNGRGAERHDSQNSRLIEPPQAAGLSRDLQARASDLSPMGALPNQQIRILVLPSDRARRASASPSELRQPMRCSDSECDQRSDSERCFGCCAWRE